LDKKVVLAPEPAVLDALIERHSKGWALSRIAPLNSGLLCSYEHRVRVD